MDKESEGRHLAGVDSEEKIIATRHRYRASTKGRDSQRRYEETEPGQQAIKKYQDSPKFKLAIDKWRNSDKGKEWIENRGNFLAQMKSCEAFLKENPGITPEDFFAMMEEKEGED